MEFKNQAKGVVPEIPSIRQYDYELVCGATSTSAEYPSKWGINKTYAGKVKNQGEVGSCVAMVISSLMEVLYRINQEKLGYTEETDLYMDFSEGWGYGAFRDSSSRNEGLIVSSALKYWKDLGMLPQKYFDMLYEMPQIKKDVQSRKDLYELAAQYKIGGYVSINYGDKGTGGKRDLAIKDALTKYGYGLLAVSNDYFGEGHCIMITGWDDEKDKYEFKNSWGENYCNEGFGYIPKDEVSSVYLILPEEITLKFTDVPEDAWYYKYIRNAYLSGLVNGTSETTFEPDRPVTRAEFATGLYNLAKVIDKNNQATMESLELMIDRKLKNHPI
jgi:hypothetical protein